MTWRWLRAGLWPALLGLAAAAPIDLDNGVIRVSVDPERGGAVTRIFYENAMSFPLIAGRGVGVAGVGRLFSPALESGGVAAGAMALKAESRGRDRVILVGDLEEIGLGLRWRRAIRLLPNGSGFSVEDEVRNDSERSYSVRLGSDSVQEAEPWRLTDRTWLGSDSTCIGLSTSDREPSSPPIQTSGRRLFWRQIEQYGTGFLYRASWPAGAEISAEILPGAGRSVGVALRSAATSLPAHGRFVFSAEVTVDEGGGAPDQGNAFYPTLARADVAAAGRSGQPVLGFGTVVSARSETCQVVIHSDRELSRSEVRLVAGKVARVPFRLIPTRRERAPIVVSVISGGAEIGRGEASVAIDGDVSDPIWRRYARRFPEERYRGSWESIGEQLVRGGQPIGLPTSMPIDIAKEPGADNGLDFYGRVYPQYAELIRGIAKASGAPANRVFLRGGDEDPRGGCLDAVYYGPDGPINAFSKERYEPDFHGEGYVKVIPDRGYAFHYFEYYGVNSEGLSISGAACCEDARTHEWAMARLRERGRSGGHSLPMKAGMWLIYATCRDVAEALRLIANPAAPMVFNGNMFLVDRAGHAARVESVGMEHRIYRHSPGEGGLFVAGNYLHSRSDGYFGIGRWSWAANSMLREEFLREFVGARQGGMSLGDVMAVMQTHEAGGLCQHHHDNPARLYTCCSYLAVPRSSELWLAEGPPCEVGYVRYRLKD